jgi:hypothetical protein
MNNNPIRTGDKTYRPSFVDRINDDRKKQKENNEESSDRVTLRSEGESAKGVNKKWLIMNYVAADCNLLPFQMANIDNMEMVGSDKDTHIVTLVDVGPKPLKDQIMENPIEPGDWSGARTLYIIKDGEVGTINSDVIAEHGDRVDMSNPETLKNFVVDTMKDYPAQHTALIFNDHGGGHTGAMADDSDGNFMPIQGMNEALAEAEEETGKKLDIIGFDACVMAQLEVAYELKDRADILLASQENEKGHGWTYEKVYNDKDFSGEIDETDSGYISEGNIPGEEIMDLTGHDGMLGGHTIGEALRKSQKDKIYKINASPVDFAKMIVEINSEHNDVIPTFSATNLNKIDGLKESVDKLAETIIKSKDKETVRKAVENAENYGGGWSPYKEMRDLGHICNNIIDTTSDDDVKEAAKEVRKSLKKAVIANQVNPDEHPKSEGLSIYAPTMDDFGPEYMGMSFVNDTKWDEAVEAMGVKYNPDKEEPLIWPDGSRRFGKIC